MDPEVPGSSPGGGTISLAAPGAYKNAHARYAEYTARALGYGFRSLDAKDGYLFEISDGPRRAYFASGAGSPYAFNAAHANAIARDKSFAQRVLAANGLATIPSELFFTTDRWAALRAPGREAGDALRYAAGAAYPLFCKPLNGAQGAYAEIIRDYATFERYLARVAATRHYAILVQPVIAGEEHRLLVMNGRILFAYRKYNLTLTGDGTTPLGALMRDAIAAKDGAVGDIAETVRARADDGRLFGPADVAPAGLSVTVEGAANRALGGAASPPSAEAAPHLAQFALACAAALRLNLAAVDLFDRPEGPVAIEVNANPAIKTLEDHGRWDLIETIWTANFAAALR